MLLLICAFCAWAQTLAPPGKMVAVGGYHVHVNCTGSGTPAVVIVGAGFSFDWSLVQPAAAGLSGQSWLQPA